MKPENGALPLNCLNNVNSYIRKYGGKAKFGWIFSCLGNVAIKMTSHAVVQQEDGSLICVTPNEYRKGPLKFAPDDFVEELIKDNFLPLKFVALVNDSSLEAYLELERLNDKLRIDGRGVVAQSDLEKINARASMLLSQLNSLAMKYTGRNDLCYCGSGKKNKKCCR